jgi:drug/metabolite transporter (DMT)-like permease
MTPFVLSIVLLSALIHAVWSVVIKGSRSPLAFNLTQALWLAVLAIPVFALSDLGAISERFWWLLAITAVFHGLYMYWLSLAYELADLSLVYPIARSTPAFLPLFAIPLLGEEISWIGGAGIATVVAGMWAVQIGDSTARRLSPRRAWWKAFTGRHLAYAYLALAGTIGFTLADKLIMVELANAEWQSPVPISIFCFFAIWVSCSVVFVPLGLRHVDRGVLREVVTGEWRNAGMASVISIVGYGLILKALETDATSYVVTVRQSSVLFVLLFSVAFLGERPGRLRILGGIATVVGVAMIAEAP